MVYWGLGIAESFENLAMLFVYAVLLNFVMSAQGWFCGSLSESEEFAK